MRSILLLGAVCACNGDPESELDCPTGYVESNGVCLIDSSGVCSNGFELGDDGMCYPAEGVGDAVLDYQSHWPTCELGEGDGRLDLRSGCADDICSGMTYNELVELLGEPVCEGDFLLDCQWENHAGGQFYDFDGDGEVDDPSDELFMISVYSGFDGHTDDGLGVDQSLACWTAGIGQPDRVEFYRTDEGGFGLAEMAYLSDYFLYVVDDEPYDGRVDRVDVFGF